MAKLVKKRIDFNLSTMPPRTKKALDFLAGQEWLKSSAWYLAGGTALALSTGLRKSVDLDFFTQLKDFDNDALLSTFFSNSDWKTTINKKNTIYGELFKAKVSFIAYPFFAPKQEMLEYGFVKVLQPLDIAVMKIIAISQRGRKRDFFDLYWCVKNIEPLEELMGRLKIQYPTVAHDYHHIFKSIMYYEDAEADSVPELNFKASWNEVKKYFNKEVPLVMKRLIDL